MTSAFEQSPRAIRRRIVVGVAVAVALTIALGFSCLLALRRSVRLDHEALDRANAIAAFGSVRTALEEKMNAFRSYLADPQDSLLADLRTARGRIRGILEDFGKRSAPSERRLLDRIGAAEEAHQAVLEEAIARRRAGESRDSIAVYLVRESGARRQTLEEAIDRFLQVERAKMEDVASLSRHESVGTTTFIVGMTVIAVLLIVLLGADMVRRLARSFQIERDQRERAESAESRSAFLAEASQVLGSSLEYRTTLSSVARLAVPKISDWCFVDMMEEGSVRRVAVSQRSTQHAALARELEERHLLDPNAAAGPPQVIRSGRPELRAEITEDFLRSIARTPEDFTVLARMGIRSTMCVPIRAREGVLGVLTFVSSESARRFGTNDLFLAEELARRAGVAIDNARLYRDAREAVRLRDEFLSVASHELKTPITTLQLQIQSLARRARSEAATTMPDKLLPRLVTAEHQIGRLARLVSNLLDISRITAGPLDLELETVDLAAIVRETLSRYSEELDRAGCAVTLGFTGDSHVALWDRTRIEQVLTNLLSNACKYGAGGPVEVALSSSLDTSRLSVRDHGIGIGLEHQERVFDRFERAVSVRHYGGLGLGLWIVRQVVDAMGGNISVESRPGDGSLFVVELPRRQESSAERDLSGRFPMRPSRAEAHES